MPFLCELRTSKVPSFFYFLNLYPGCAGMLLRDHLRVITALSAARFLGSTILLSMPLLQHILDELDRELTRLHAIRTIVAGLSRTPVLVSRPTAPALQPAPPAVAEPKRTRRPRSVAGRRRGPHSPKPALEPRALATNVPSGPVVFNPDRLARERARRQESREAESSSKFMASPAEDMDALSRDLAARWMAGAMQ